MLELTLAVLALVAMTVITAFNGHASLLEQSLTRTIGAALGGPFAGLAIVSVAMAGIKSTEWSRLFVYSFTGLSCVGLTAYRLAGRKYFARRRRHGVYARNILFVGSPIGISQAMDRFGGSVGNTTYRPFGFLALSGYAAADYAVSLACHGTVEQIDSLLVRNPINQVVAVLPPSGASWLERLLYECDQVGVPVEIIPEPLLSFSPVSLSYMGSGVAGGPGILLAQPTWNSEMLFFKRLLDLALASMALIVLSPLMLAIALAVRLSSPGPVLYPWRVIGHHGEPFTGFKFRTMVDNADQLKDTLQAYNEMSGPVFKMTKDPRITPVGRVLRKFSLDELPQLFSVLKGDMSLVGPRPAGPHELARYEFWQMRKLSIRPGITCLWQVRGRNAISDFTDWVKLDLQYIDHWSLWLDAKILLWTVKAVLAGTGK